MNQFTRTIKYRIPRWLKAFTQSALKPVLRPIGFLHVDYGSACGRNWIKIDGYEIAQSSSSTVNVPDEIVERIIYHTIDHGKHHSKPFLNVIYQPILNDYLNDDPPMVNLNMPLPHPKRLLPDWFTPPSKQ